MFKVFEPEPDDIPVTPIRYQPFPTSVIVVVVFVPDPPKVPVSKLMTSEP
jgi:hypothetical protein